MLSQVSRSTIARTGNLGGYQLFQDSFPLKVLDRKSVLTEGKDGMEKRVLRLTGQFQRAGRPNSNGRIYPGGVLQQAIDEIQEDIKARRVLGEFDHPPDAKIHLDRVSHLITKLWMEGDVVYGECEILENTTYGSQLKALIESNVCVGISSRGVGDMETTMFQGEEYYKVTPGYTFVTFDMVAEPSVHGSYMTVMENRNRMLGRKRPNHVNREEQMVRELRGFLNGLK